MWKNFVQWGRPQMTVEHMRIARWISKATHTHTQNILVKYLLLLHYNNGCTIAPHCYVICTLPVLSSNVSVLLWRCF